MNERVRAVLLGLGVGLAPLLLLDLAQQLHGAADGPGDSTLWWAVGVHLLVGVVVAVGVVLGRSDRLAPAVAAVVVLLAVLPALPGQLFRWAPEVPVLSVAAGELPGIALLALGAYLYAAIRGGRA